MKTKWIWKEPMVMFISYDIELFYIKKIKLYV